ncbi:hypothetical protein Hdeb2414_s0004g00133861 [Helianthus debilis subsp. tardiflorus]
MGNFHRPLKTCRVVLSWSRHYLPRSSTPAQKESITTRAKHQLEFHGKANTNTHIKRAFFHLQIQIHRRKGLAKIASRTKTQLTEVRPFVHQYKNGEWDGGQELIPFV